ncbi:MAG: hypothetical protein ABSG80_04835 [Verrucomicrobiota bacterium]
MLNLEQLKVAVAAARRQFGLIRKKYPELKAYLVLSLPGGQTVIDSSPAQILKEFPAMVVDDSNKSAALDLQSSLELLEWKDKNSPEIQKLKKQLDQIASRLKFDEKCQVEIRFNDLKYDLVWKLQADDLIDHSLTPQTKASIRIVLGTISQFERTHHER